MTTLHLIQYDIDSSPISHRPHDQFCLVAGLVSVSIMSLLMIEYENMCNEGLFNFFYIFCNYCSRVLKVCPLAVTKLHMLYDYQSLKALTNLPQIHTYIVACHYPQMRTSVFWNCHVRVTALYWFTNLDECMLHSCSLLYYFCFSFTANIPALDASCNQDCGCSTQYYEPVCSSQNIQYFSPCHAGCLGTVNEEVRTNNHCYCFS